MQFWPRGREGGRQAGTQAGRQAEERQRGRHVSRLSCLEGGVMAPKAKAAAVAEVEVPEVENKGEFEEYVLKSGAGDVVSKLLTALFLDKNKPELKDCPVAMRAYMKRAMGTPTPEELKAVQDERDEALARIAELEALAAEKDEALEAAQAQADKLKKRLLAAEEANA